jgi:hypothetical protein
MTTYFETREFENSKQKTEGDLLGVGADIHDTHAEYKFAYEYAKTETIQPPLSEDLLTQKLFLRYGYAFDNGVTLHTNYLNILADNIAPTNHGVAYGMGVNYEVNPHLLMGVTQFYSDYKEFNVYQSDVKLEFKTKLESVKIKLTSLTHYIRMDEYKENFFSKNAEASYLSSALKLHAHYNSYHFGAASYAGKRLFAIMDDGFKIQHHAMEFDRTYALGVGKSFGDVVLRFQYIYQRATELPQQNPDVEVRNLRFIANYSF